LSDVKTKLAKEKESKIGEGHLHVSHIDIAQLSCYIPCIFYWKIRGTKMANITLKIDEELLKKARQLAFQRKTSINAIVKRRLEEFVSSDLNREVTLKGLEAFFRRSKARVGKKIWTRDEIHER